MTKLDLRAAHETPHQRIIRLSTVPDQERQRRHDHWAGMIVAVGVAWLVGVWMGASQGRLLLGALGE